MSENTEEIRESVEAPVPDADIEERKTTRVLKYVFTSTERLDMGDHLANGFRNLQSTQDELSAVQAQYKSAMKRIQGEITGIVHKVNSGWEMRTTECKEVLNYRTGNAEIFRLDTGELIEERPLTATERQYKLHLVEKEEEAEEAAPAEAPQATDLAATNSEVGM